MKKLDLLNTKETKKDEQNWYSVKEICSNVTLADKLG